MNIDQDDIAEFYKKMMRAQSAIGSSHLAAGGNLGRIVAAYIYAKYGVVAPPDEIIKEA